MRRKFKEEWGVKNHWAAFAAGVSFIVLASGANMMTASYGMVELPFGLLVTAGTFAAGMVLLARDVVNEVVGRAAVVGFVVIGALVSGLTAPWALAVASGVAFLIAELIDWAVYEPMRHRGWARAVLLSSIVAAPLDTVIFLWLAGFGVTWQAVAGQWIVKTVLALAFVLAVKVVVRAVFRNRVITGNA